MAKFSGNIGYVESVEQDGRPGKFIETVIEKPAKGNVLKDFRRYQSNDNLQSSLNVSDRISVIANDYILNNTHKMKYLVKRGVRWNIVSFEISHPRVILSIGGVYNGPIPTTT